MDIPPMHDGEMAGGTTDDLTALLGSRICHDLISPLGAISNGVELLMMSGSTSGPEIALIAQSVASANARIRFFRVAFGAQSFDQQIGLAEVLSILDGMTRGGRLTIDYLSAPQALRGAVKIAFLALLCCETAMPYGGRIRINNSADTWLLEAEADRLKINTGHWDRISGRSQGGPLSAAHVQFALLPDEARRQGRMLQLKLTETRIVLRY